MEILKGLKLLIFDIDGVLVDVRQSYRQAIKLTTEHFSGTEVSHEEIQGLKNESGYNNDWDLTQELLKRKGFTPSREDIVNYFQSIYWGDRGNGLIKDEPWLLKNEILDQLKNTYQLAVFTGRPKEEARFVLNKNGMSQHIQALVAMEDVTKGKPDPEGLFKILSDLTLSANKACYFGDTYDDMRCAVKAGVKAFAVLPPGAKKEDMANSYIDSGANIILKTINEI